MNKALRLEYFGLTIGWLLSSADGALEVGLYRKLRLSSYCRSDLVTQFPRQNTCSLCSEISIYCAWLYYPRTKDWQDALLSVEKLGLVHFLAGTLFERLGLGLSRSWCYAGSLK